MRESGEGNRRVRERERVSERQSERQTDTQTHRHTAQKRHRHKEEYICTLQRTSDKETDLH